MTGAWKPRMDQQQVLDWWADRPRGAVFAGCGTGKTVVTATWVQDALRGRRASRALIVAPRLVAAFGWPVELRKWSHLAPLAASSRSLTFADLMLTTEIRPDGRRGGLVFTDKRGTKRHLSGLAEQVHVCSWDAFPWLAKAYGSAWPYDLVVFDESSHLRDQRSERGRAARYVVHKLGAVSHIAELTATPAENHDEALWAQLDLLERGALGATLTEFRETLCVPATRNWSTGQVYSWRISPAGRPRVDEALARLAITVPDPLGIPVVTAERWVALPDDARQDYREMTDDSVLPDVTATSAAARYDKLRQIATGFVYRDDGTARLLHDAKGERAAELIDEIEGQVVVAYEYKAELARLRKRFGTHLVEMRDPGAFDRFLAGRPKILALHPASAGHGVDGLQGRANHMVWMTCPDDAELYKQANGRLRRDGQEKPVYVHMLLAQDTVEGEIWREVLPGKRSRADMILRSAARLPGRDS